MNMLPKQPTVPPIPNTSEDKRFIGKFKLDGDYIYRSIPITKTAMFTEYREEIVMDKKTIIEAFEKWIEKRA